MSYTLATIGSDCSPAAALRNLNIRDVALPFDWVVSNIRSLQICLEEDFDRYHTDVCLNANKSRVIDAYGFEFPHDYPLTNMNSDRTKDVGEGQFGEEAGQWIREDWMQYYPTVKEKYNRRIERFRAALNDTKPLVVFCRYHPHDVLALYALLCKHSKGDAVYIINSSSDHVGHPNILNVHTERNGVWNEAAIWKEALDTLTFRFCLNST